MLTITRKTGQSFEIGDNITVHIGRINGNQVKVSIDAPKEVPIVRNELIEGLPLAAVEFLNE